MKQVDEIIEKFKNTKYSSDNTDLPILSSQYSKNEETAIRQVLLEWIQDNFNQNYIEQETLKQRIMILEEIVKKSNFRPMIEEKHDE